MEGEAEDAAAVAGGEESIVGEAPRDPIRGYVGDVYSTVFQELYTPPDAAEAAEEAPAAAHGGAQGAAHGGGGGEEDAEAAEEPVRVDLSAEEGEIAAIHGGLMGDHARLDKSIAHLREKKDEALRQDREYAEHLQQRWGLTVREQIPVTESVLKDLLRPERLEEDRLSVPRQMMTDVERHTAMRSGLLKMHENILAVSQPEQPSYFKETASAKIRLHTKNIQPHLTHAQRGHLAETLAERMRKRPPQPAMLNADEREANREIVESMFAKINFLRNPRYGMDRTAQMNPFAIMPQSVIFRNYEVGNVYEITVELRNVDRVGRRVRVKPCANAAFAITHLQYGSDTKGRVEPFTVIAPGMAAFVTVRFAPGSMVEMDERLVVETELGDFALPVRAQRVNPKLEFRNPVNCGSILAGQQATVTTRISNKGGEGSFRLIAAEEAATSCQYETLSDGSIRVWAQQFRVVPSCFYLEAGQSVELEITYSSTEVGFHSCPFLVESDNGEKTPLLLKAISDAVRLELVRWPTLPHAVRPVGHQILESGVSPLALLPWQLNWLSPGAQVGCSEAQAITLSNGSYLPVKVEWRFVAPPIKLLSQLAVGNQPRLTREILESIHTWSPHDKATHGQAACPFTVTPPFATLEPFQTASFTFAFYAHAPVGHQSTAFAYLAAVDLPSGGHCLPNLDALIGLQERMQPEGYPKGFPLFGGAMAKLFDVKPLVDQVADGDAVSESGRHLEAHQESANCAITTVCLQGRSIAPSISALPRVVVLSGDVPPFVSHTREVVLRNTGPMAANFRVRLTSKAPPTARDNYDPIWVVSSDEVGARPKLPELPRDTSAPPSPELAAQWLAAQWPPLPPEGDGEAFSSMGGFGAFVTVAVEPHQGTIPAGESVKVSLVLRAAREVDLDVQLLIDMPMRLDSEEAVAEPIKIPILAAVRAPRVELRRTSFLDYGVVRAHSRHKAKLCVNNPSDLPMLVRLTHRREPSVDAASDPVSAEPSADMRACTSLLAARGFATMPQAHRLGELAHVVGARRTVDLNEKRAHLQDEYFRSNFSMNSHQEVVDFFLSAVQTGHANQTYCAVSGEEMREGRFEPWAHARSGCVDMSGRRKHSFLTRGHKDFTKHDDEEDLGIVDDSTDLLFEPACFVLWPRQCTEVDVTLRTAHVRKYRALLEATSFDSTHSQCVEVFADVQLPKVRLSTQHAHFPITYLKTASTPLELVITNDSDMPASYDWQVPLRLEDGLEVQVQPSKGEIPPRGKARLQVTACPTRESKFAEITCQVFVGEVIQPLALMVSAVVYGPEVDWTVVSPGELPPQIKHQPRSLTQDQIETYQVQQGRARRGTPVIDFGEIQIGETRELQLVLYNRTGIATPFQIKLKTYPAYDPLSKGRIIGDLLNAATRMYQLAGAAGTSSKKETFANEPQPAGKNGGGESADEGQAEENEQLSETIGVKSDATMRSGRGGRGKRAVGRGSRGGVRFEPRTGTGSKKQASSKRRLLLDDAHEKQAFTSSVGVDYMRRKEMKQQGTVALKMGRGFAVKADPPNDWLLPFGTAVVTLKCFSDLPGIMEDELILSVRELQGHSRGGDYRIPIRLVSHGNPLYLPDQQIGLSKLSDPPRLLCGTMVPAEKYTVRNFKVGNNASTPIKISWEVYPKQQMNNKAQGRRFINLALCRTGEDDPFAEEGAADRAAPRKKASHAGGARAHAGGGESADEGYEEDVGLEELVEQLALEEGEDEEAEEDVAPFKFMMWARDPPKIKDPFALPGPSAPGTGPPPIRIEPQEAILPVHGTSLFTVTMLASEATRAAEGNYRYVLVGKGKFTEEHNRSMASLDESPFNTNAAVTVTSMDVVEEKTAFVGKHSLQVSLLPQTPLDDLHDDDSDNEKKSKAPADAKIAVSTRSRADERLSRGKQGLRPLPIEPGQDVISTIVVDCVGDCVVPHLTVDKMEYPIADARSELEDEAAESERMHCPVFKFIHSVIASEGTRGSAREEAGGATHGGARGGSQHPGVASYLVRTITLSNMNAGNVNCRFRLEGPFQIKQINQVGRHPVNLGSNSSAEKTKRPNHSLPEQHSQLYIVAKRETISLLVEFVPSMVPASQIREGEAVSKFTGDLFLEYPRDAQDPLAQTDLQRIHLTATSRRPALCVTLVPHAGHDPKPQTKLAHQPTWSGTPTVLVEFGYVHVNSSTSRTREILLSNATPVMARWTLLHVGRKRRPAHDIGNALREEEDFRALDDKDVFEFDASHGSLLGPTRDGKIHGSDERQVHWCQVPSAQTRGPKHVDEDNYIPKRIRIVFKPKKNELYKCKFRIQVEGGPPVDFLCRGCGSYDEEDDAMEFHEA